VKRVLDVVDIFAKVKEKLPAKLLFVGEGPELSKVMMKVREMKLSDSVMFAGKQDDVAQVISMADLLLLPSEKESFGLVALEAMACGVPTVGSNAGGIPELITHGETGYLADVGDVAAMARFAVKLLGDAAQYARVREACLHRSRYTFCNDRITRQYEEIYFRVLGRELPESILAQELNC
jgi:N-acetyl-alpha-D-glucosaminyl L-malate synthase BshA